MSISFRQRTLNLSLQPATGTQLLVEGTEGTFTNGADTISIQITNLGPNALQTTQVLVDSGGYGDTADYVEDTASTTAIGAIASGASVYRKITPNGWKRFKLVGTSAGGTFLRIQVVGVNAQGN